MANRTYLLLIVAAVVVVAGVSIFLIMGTPPAEPPPKETVKERSITLIADDIKFNVTNPTINVKVGETVKITVINRDQVPHNFVIEGVAGGATDLLTTEKSQTITVTFQKAGTYKYVCTIHPALMDGSIIVQ